MRGDDFRFALDLPARNHWENVELLRTSVQSCVRAVLEDVAGSDALAMVTGELLENAIKHGCWRGDDELFRLRVWGDTRCGCVSVESPVGADADAQRVFDAIAWIRGFESPELAYQARMIEIAGAPRDGVSSGLGLPRIVYEGGCTLEAKLEDKTLSVTARMAR